MERELLSDEKEKAEHVMLVDLARNDCGRVSQIGSVKVTEFMRVQRYSHVMHIVSLVEGKNTVHVIRLIWFPHFTGRNIKRCTENPCNGNYR